MDFCHELVSISSLRQFIGFLFCFQHDCQEFLALLLDGLHEQMNTAGIHFKKLEEDFQDLDKMNTAGIHFTKLEEDFHDLDKKVRKFYYFTGYIIVLLYRSAMTV